MTGIPFEIQFNKFVGILSIRGVKKFSLISGQIARKQDVLESRRDVASCNIILFCCGQPEVANTVMYFTFNTFSESAQTKIKTR